MNEEERREKEKRAREFEIELLEDGIKDVEEGKPCPYQRENSIGIKYCAAVGLDEDFHGEVNTRCPYVGQERDVSSTKRFGETDFMPNSKEGRQIQEQCLNTARSITSEFGKKVRDRIWGNPELDLRISMEYSCSYTSQNKGE